MIAGCTGHAPSSDPDCGACKAIVDFDGIDASARRLCAAAKRWAESRTDDDREGLLASAVAYQGACLRYAEVVSHKYVSEERGGPDER